MRDQVSSASQQELDRVGRMTEDGHITPALTDDDDERIERQMGKQLELEFRRRNIDIY